MLILISSEKTIHAESAIVEELLERFPLFRFHLRKPKWRSAEKVRFIRGIDAKYHTRISVHSRSALPQLPDGVRWHLSGSHSMSASASSTSFHRKKEIISSGGSYDYFFCSPVFPSISKKHHVPKHQWTLEGIDEDLARKAIALGGMDARTMQRAVQLGFKHYAVLGSVWNAEKPSEAFEQIYKSCPNIDPIV